MSARTVDRHLQEAGLFGRVARQKRDYSEGEVKKRLSFAEGYAHWTAEDWSKVLFSDEKIFWGRGKNGQTWVRRPKGEALNPCYTLHKQAHPVKVNVWACFSAAGQGFSYIFSDTLDANLAKTILSENLLESAEELFPAGAWWLLHDNDKKFKSRLVQTWLHNNGVSVLDFPPYSPDLNPIENLWKTLARAVEDHRCDTVASLQDAVAEEWDKIDPQHMHNLVRSMPERCTAVIEAAGWHTKY